MTRIAMIKRLDNDSLDLIQTNNPTINISRIVDMWQREKVHIIGRIPPVKYKWAEASNLVDALIESRDF